MRIARRQSEADIYHVLARGTGRQLIFEDDADRREFLSIMEDSLVRTDAELYAWCLMGNHFHLLIHAPLGRISECMRLLCGGYARSFNEKYGRVGHLFQERFKSEPVEDDGYLLTVVRYIHLNPSEAAIADFNEYAWSSYGEYLGSPRYCSIDDVAGLFAGPQDYRAFHEGYVRANECLETGRLRNATRSMPDAVALGVASRALGDVATANIKSLERTHRNALLCMLMEEGLSIRQIERLTGIGRGSIARAWAKRDK